MALIDRTARTRRRFGGDAALLLGLCACAGSAAISCASDGAQPTSLIGLNIVAPKGLLDNVDTVKLRVYDKSVTQCKGSSLPTPEPPPDSSAVFTLSLTGKGCPAGKKWCGSGEIAIDKDKPLVFYVSGSKGGGSSTMEGCVERAVDQNPLQVDIKVSPVIVGGKCGDASLAPPETCDPGTGKGDEACDDATCQTKEVVLGNGTAAAQYSRGLPTRKRNIALSWLPDGKFFAVWSDAATGGAGGDGNPEITVRRLTQDLLTETSSTALATELRLQTNDPFSAFGSKRRNGKSAFPTVVPIESGNLFVVFAREPAGGTGNHVWGTVQRVNLGAALSADVEISADTAVQDAPSAAGNGSGEVLIAWVEGGAIKSALRKPAGAPSTPQTLTVGGTNATPRVAWVGGDFIVVWTDGDDIKFRRVGADGVPKGAEAVANASRKTGKQDQPDVAGFSTGEFLVTWRDAAGDVGADIRVQKFDKAGAAVGTEIGSPLNDVAKDGDQGMPRAATGLVKGGQRFYLVAWENPAAQTIAARFVNADAEGFLINNVSKTSSEFSAVLAAGPRSSPAVATSASYCAIAWADDTDADAAGDDDRVRVRRFPLPFIP